MKQQSVFTGNGFPRCSQNPYNSVLYKVMSVFNAVPLEESSCRHQIQIKRTFDYNIIVST